MGVTKRLLEEREAIRADAMQFLLRIGTLQECEHHGIIYEDDGDLERVYRIAMAERNKEGMGLVDWAASMKARELTDILKDTYEDHCADVCYACDKIANE